MKSTQKFLCYSLALVGAALIFSAGCKKGDTVAGPTYVTAQIPVLNTNGPAFVGVGGTSATVAAQDVVAFMGSSSLTSVGFNYTATALTYTGSTTPTFSGSITATVPASGTGAFSATLFNAAVQAALSGTVAGANNVLWHVQSFATNSNGTVYSALTNTITTTN